MTDLKMLFDIGNPKMSIRGMKDADGLEFWSVHDFINTVCNKDGTYGKNTYYRLIAEGSEHKDEINSLCQPHKVAGICFIVTTDFPLVFSFATDFLSFLIYNKFIFLSQGNVIEIPQP